MYQLTYKLSTRLAIIFSLLLTITGSVKAQKYFTKNGHISFFSKTSLENITADNNQVLSILNIPQGELQFSMLIKNFLFKKALMQEHFNENYMESDKFPKAVFKGNIADLSKVSFTADGTYGVTVAGDLTIHGITKKITPVGSIVIKAGKIAAVARFMVKPADYNIIIPKLVRDNIAETIEVTVQCDYNQKM